MKNLKFLSFVVIVLGVVSVANAQTKLRQPPLYDKAGYYVPPMPSGVSGPVFVNKQIPHDRKNISVDIKKDKLFWGGKVFPWAVGINMRYHGRAGGPSVRVRTNRSRVSLIRNTRVNNNFWRDVKRQNKRR